jgi:hypothetical protein
MVAVMINNKRLKSIRQAAQVRLESEEQRASIGKDYRYASKNLSPAPDMKRVHVKCLQGVSMARSKRQKPSMPKMPWEEI